MLHQHRSNSIIFTSQLQMLLIYTFVRITSNCHIGATCTLDITLFLQAQFQESISHKNRSKRFQVNKTIDPSLSSEESHRWFLYIVRTA